MSDKITKQVSKFMSLVLRHAPQKAGLTLDSAGWASLPALSGEIEKRFGLSEADLRKIVETNDKKRFTINGDRIRAAQGHSVEVNLDLQPRSPEGELFHGTTELAWQSIETEGLRPQQRQHVHLSADVETAWKVAKRRKGPHVILLVDCVSIQHSSGQFYLAENGVWLIDHVSPSHLTIIDSSS